MELDFEKCVKPYYLENAIYNESVLLIKENGIIKGFLAFDPEKIIEISDYTLKKKFDLSDFRIEGNKITLINENDGVPYLSDENLKGIGLDSKYLETRDFTECDKKWMFMADTIYTESDLYYGHQIQVTYTYDRMKIDKSLTNNYGSLYLTNAKKLLEKGSGLRISAIGDSVMEGCSSSKRYNHEPFMDSFADLYIKGIREKYKGEIVFNNLAVGGKTSVFGASDEELQKLSNTNPDLLYIHFGVNDLGEKRSDKELKNNFEKIINHIKTVNNKVEIVVILPFPPNPTSYKMDLLKKYIKSLWELEKENENVYILDMYTLGQYLLNRKNYYDLCANGINHLNDFTSRLYAMEMLGQLIEF